MSRPTRALAALLCSAALMLAACEESPFTADESASAASPAAPTGTPPTAFPPTTYDIPFRTDAELDRAIGHVCRDAVERDRPLLLEFSAAWCSDCRKLNDMKANVDLAAELSEWPSLTVNVGRFDRHTELMASLEIESIAHWSIFTPSNCDAPVSSWPRSAARTLEVSSGAARNLTPRDLAEWLATFRDAGAV